MLHNLNVKILVIVAVASAVQAQVAHADPDRMVFNFEKKTVSGSWNGEKFSRKFAGIRLTMGDIFGQMGNGGFVWADLQMDELPTRNTVSNIFMTVATGAGQTPTYALQQSREALAVFVSRPHLYSQLEIRCTQAGVLSDSRYSFTQVDPRSGRKDVWVGYGMGAVGEQAVPCLVITTLKAK